MQENSDPVFCIMTDELVTAPSLSSLGLTLPVHQPKKTLNQDETLLPPDFGLPFFQIRDFRHRTFSKLSFCGNDMDSGSVGGSQAVFTSISHLSLLKLDLSKKMCSFSKLGVSYKEQGENFFTSVTFDKDLGKLIAVGDYLGGVKVMDQAGRSVNKFEGKKFTAVGFRGNLLAAASLDGFLKLFDVRDSVRMASLHNFDIIVPESLLFKKVDLNEGRLSVNSNHGSWFFDLRKLDKPLCADFSESQSAAATFCFSDDFLTVDSINSKMLLFKTEKKVVLHKESILDASVDEEQNVCLLTMDLQRETWLRVFDSGLRPVSSTRLGATEFRRASFLCGTEVLLQTKDSLLVVDLCNGKDNTF